MTAHAATRLSDDTEVPDTLPQSGRSPLSRAPLIPPASPDWGLALGISTTDFAARAFTDAPSSLQSVRSFVRETLHSWGLEYLIDDLMLVASELTTNAVRHALTANGNAHGKAWLGIARTGGTVICAVSDPSPTPPLPRTCGDLTPEGRGLHVVNALTSQWGYAANGPSGKTVWARMVAHSL